jgi:protein TonB
MFSFLAKHEQFTAITLAIMLHVSLGLCLIERAVTNELYLPQSLQVSLVAPSTSPSASLKMQAQPQKQNLEKTGAKSAKQNVKNEGTESVEKQTSGKESPEATALNSAITEPVFNAKYLNNPVPIYPSSAKRDGIQGRVLLLVEVSVEGFAKEVKISGSSGYSSLDNAAKSAVLGWKFIPAKQYGKAIEASVLVPIEFKLS